ncbi:MAG: hypothetical protein M3O82_01050 [Verrucomicrobiota bacterium]|nr:hypothetical protein [Verrucomicrobiota bacterium]
MKSRTLVACVAFFVALAAADATVIPLSRVSSVEIVGMATDTGGTSNYHEGPQFFSGPGQSALSLSGGVQSPLLQVTAFSSAVESSNILLDDSAPFGATATAFTSATLDPANITGGFIPGTLATGRSAFEYTFRIDGESQAFTLSGFIAHTNDGIAILSLKDVATAPDDFIAFTSLSGDDVGERSDLIPISGVLLAGHDYRFSLFADSTANRDSIAEYNAALTFVPEGSALVPLLAILIASAAWEWRTRRSTLRVGARDHVAR